MLSIIKSSLIEAMKVSDDMSDTLSDVKIDKALLRWRKIEKYLKTHDYIMNADIRNLCGVSAATANRILLGLVKEGKLCKYHTDRH